MKSEKLLGFKLVPTLGLPEGTLFLTDPSKGFHRGEMHVLGAMKGLSTMPWMEHLVAESAKVQTLLARACAALGPKEGKLAFFKLMEESRGSSWPMVEYLEQRLPELFTGISDKGRLGFGPAFEKSALKTICGRDLDPEATCTCGGPHP